VVRGGDPRGVIIAALSTHEKAPDGGRYLWNTVGPVPELPPELATLLPDAAIAQGAATETQVTGFLDPHTEAQRPELLDLWRRNFAKDVANSASRHDSMVSKLVGAVKEARASFFDARIAADTLQAMFLDAVGQMPMGRQGAVRTGALAYNEWVGILAWAVAQAMDANLDEVRARVAEREERMCTIGAPVNVASAATAAWRRSMLRTCRGRSCATAPGQCSDFQPNRRPGRGRTGG
jgi:hypothetical protein